jgi:hypothetical protein
MIIDGIEYVPRDHNQESTLRKIVIGDRGWVWIGDVWIDDHEVVITNCSNIRKWGTEKGLGQIALSGVTDDTVLDPCPTVRIHPQCVVAMYDVRGSDA